MSHYVDIHPATLVDLPTLHGWGRGGALHVVLDSELAYTREVNGGQTALLSSLLRPSRGLITLVGRPERGSGCEAIVGQLRLKTADHLAQIVSIAGGGRIDAPEIGDDGAWLQMLDAMTAEAGRRGAYMLTAEVDECSPLFVTMRTAGFAVYARQEIWALDQTVALPALSLPGTLADESDDDAMDIQLLYSNIVPRLVQPIAVPSRESRGLVYRGAGRTQGYIAVSEGRGGLYLMPFLHPDVLGHEAGAIICGALQFIAGRKRADRPPVYVCVRRYQDWLAESLAALQFTCAAQQAVLVRHIAAGIRQPQFARLAPALALTQAVSPPTTGISRVGDAHGQQPDRSGTC